MNMNFTKRQWLLVIKALGYLADKTDDMLEVCNIKEMIVSIRNRIH